MFQTFFKQLKIAVTVLVVLSLLTGIIYPLAVTGIAQILFPSRADGSLLVQNGKVIGSKLIGQYFMDSKYFWGRPSATPNFPYNAAESSGSNLGPTNPELKRLVAERIDILNKVDPTTNGQPIPVDLVTASGSGLDPDISPLAAYYQVHRVAKARGLTDEKVEELIAEHIQGRQFMILGEPRVNVLELNLALDNL